MSALKSSHPQPAHNDDTQPLDALLGQFAPISLPEIQQSAALLDRVDCKYVIGLNSLYSALATVQADYRVLTIQDKRIHAYHTLYFDTPDFALYEQHHNHIANRYKVRARKYIDTNTAFFEVKHRTNQNRTIKSRLPIADVAEQIDDEAVPFVNSHTPFAAEAYEPKLWNDYQRMTLVSKHRPERVTLDIDLSFCWEATCVALPGVVIVEIKQEKAGQQSEFRDHLRQIGAQPMGYSKYAAGVYSLYDGVKTNNFKRQRRMVDHLLAGRV